MAEPSQKAIVESALAHHGPSFMEELGHGALRNTPSALFRLLCFAHLASTRIRHDIAVHATRELFAHGWTTPRKMAEATWRERVTVLNRAGYARYDESTSARLGENAEMLLERYRGDLRRLRDEAGREPGRMRDALKAFKGIGDVGVDIFFREAQAVWPELYPFTDRLTVRAAKALALPEQAQALARLAGDEPTTFVRLLAALVRIELEKQHEAVRRAAA